MADEYDISKPKIAFDMFAPVTLTQIDYDRIREDLEMQRLLAEEQARWDKKHGWKNPSVGVCIVCSGRVFGHRSREYDPSTGPMVYGPGGANQIRTIDHGYACNDCGLMYRKCPGIVSSMTREEIEEFKG